MYYLGSKIKCIIMLIWFCVSCLFVQAQSKAPTQLSKFPDDLSSPTLEYGGMFDDGWISEISYFILHQPETTALTIRGMIPQINNSKFTTELQVLIGHKVVADQSLQVGEFTIQTDQLVGDGNKKIELRFTKYQGLPAPDSRPVAALIKFIGFEKLSIGLAETARHIDKNTIALSPNDIFVTNNGGELLAGSGWYRLETYQGKSFRWVGNDAELIVVSPPGEAQPSLDIEIEPGPGVGLKPFDLQIIRENKGGTAVSVRVNGRETVRAKLWLEPEKTEIYRLHIEGGGLPALNDPRILNFRVFCVSMVSQKGMQAATAAAMPPTAVVTYAKKRNGMFDDGWVGKKTDFKLPQLQSPAMLLVRGKILEGGGFTNELIILVDGKEITRSILKSGDFEIMMPTSNGGGVRNVRLLFAKETKLPGNDQRSVSALITFIGFEAPAKVAAKP